MKKGTDPRIQLKIERLKLEYEMREKRSQRMHERIKDRVKRRDVRRKEARKNFKEFGEKIKSIINDPKKIEKIKKDLNIILKVVSGGKIQI